MAKAKPITDLNIQASNRTNAGIIATVRLEELYSWEQYIHNPYYVRELHNLRIAAKRLRYTLEIFADVLPKETSAVLKEVEQLQEELGLLHDNDVMIALLRLCLGSLDSGSGYEYILARAARVTGKGEFTISPALVSHLLDPISAPTAQERQGLEVLLATLQQDRKEQYNSFRTHWLHLKEQNFRQKVMHLLDTEGMAHSYL